MVDYDPSAQPGYNSMQQQVGLIPPIFQPPPVPFPGQVSAAMAQGGPGAAFMTMGSAGTSFGAGMFPGQQLQGFTNQSPMFQGPTGIMMPLNPAASFGAYPGMNPYAGLAAGGPYRGAPGLFSPMAPMAPPTYSGQMAAPAFMPSVAPAQFNMAYAADLHRNQLLSDSRYASGLAVGGVGARLATDFTGGLAGAALGARFGGGFGAIAGGLAGLAGMEFSGGGQLGQNAFMNMIASPSLQQRAMTGGIEEMSRGFVNMGSSLHASGAGFSHHAAAQAAASLRRMAESSGFQMETGSRFNQQDVFRIVQEAGQNDMMSGVQSPTQMTSRVRDIAKSLSAFMSLAQEPDIQRAIQTMGQLRAAGLNLAETNHAVAQGRAFARMAGQSFSDIMTQAGGIGSQTFQAMGLTQGLGTQVGMMNYALARGSQNAGTLNPQLMNLLGGAAGYANLNNVFSASTLQMPMLAPSVMSSAGGINAGALRNLLGGNVGVFDQTSNAAAALQSMTNRQGVGGLGMAIAMQPMLQSTIGQALQNQGPFAQRNFDDRNILNLMRQMNLSGSSGYMTAAQTMGMGANQAAARAQEMASPGYFERQTQAIETTRRENRQAELDRADAEAPGALGVIMGETEGLGLRAPTHRLGRFLDHLTANPDHIMSAEPFNDAERRARNRLRRSSRFGDYLSEVSREAGEMAPNARGRRDAFRENYDIYTHRGLGVIPAALAAGLAPDTLFDNPEAARLRRGTLLDADTGSRQFGVVLGATAGDRERNRGAATTVFGSGGQGLAAQERFGQILASRTQAGSSFREAGTATMALNAGIRAGAQFVTGGNFDPGDTLNPGGMSARANRQAYIQAMRETGSQLSDAELGRIFDRDPNAALTGASGSAQINMTPLQRTLARFGVNAGQSRAGNTGNFQRVIGEQQHAAATQLFGRNAVSGEAEAFYRSYQGMSGLGAEGTSRFQNTRNYLMVRSQLVGSLQDARGQDREVIQRRITELTRNSGLNDSDIQQLNEQANQVGLRMTTAERRRARDFLNVNSRKTGQELMGTVGGALGESGAMAMGDEARRFGYGVQDLAAGRGPLSSALEGMNATNADPNEIVSRFRQLSPERIEELRRSGQGGVADAIQALKRDPQNSNARSRVLGYITERGERGVAAGRRFDEEHHGTLSRVRDFLGENKIIGGAIGGAIGGLTNPLGALLGSAAGIGLSSSREERRNAYISGELANTTAADSAAEAAQTGVSALSAAAQRAGIGGQGDPMLQAAQELRIAAQALSGVAQGDNINALLNPNP
jgi:hypothetical protein